MVTLGATLLCSRNSSALKSRHSLRRQLVVSLMGEAKPWGDHFGIGHLWKLSGQTSSSPGPDNSKLAGWFCQMPDF